MKPEIIKHKLQKYFEGESSLEDEKLLAEYFRSDQIDAELLHYRELFAGFDELRTAETESMEDNLMDYIMEAEHREKTKYRHLWQSVSGIAAALLIALLVVNYNNDKPNWKDTYSDPQQAYVEASRTLHYIAGKYQKGLAQLQPVKKLNEATKPMNEGLTVINKGFQEVGKIEKINEKLKNESHE